MSEGDLLLFVNRYKQGNLTMAAMARIIEQYTNYVKDRAPHKTVTEYVQVGEVNDHEPKIGFGSFHETVKQCDEAYGGMKHFQD